MARPGESGAAIGPKTTTPLSEATGPPDNPCGSGLPKQAVAADEWQATTEIHRAFCRYLFCRACGIAFCGNVEAVEAEDAQDSIREDFQELPILGRDRGCHPNPPLCHHVPDRPPTAGGWGSTCGCGGKRARLPADFYAHLSFAISILVVATLGMSNSFQKYPSRLDLGKHRSA